MKDISEFQLNRLLKDKNLNIKVFPQTDSTNKYLKAHPECDLAAALTQTDGRGRMGKSFSSGAGGVYFSFRADPKNYKYATVLAALAVSVTIENLLGIKTNIKWVNDILVGGKKICGILAEASLPDTLIVGVGINVCNRLPKELCHSATTLEEQNCTDVNWAKLISGIVKNFDEMSLVPKYKVIEAYKSKINYFDKPIYVMQGGTLRTCIVRDVDSDGRLVVEEKDGRISHLSSGEITTRL